MLLRRNEPRRSSRAAALPAPTPAALVGIAVLVLIGLGAVHLSGSGSAVPLHEAATASPPAVELDETATAEPGAEAEEKMPAVAGGTAPAEREDGAGSSSGDDAGSSDAGPVVVHVSGAVERPGLVELPAGARVDDAVQGAGGVTPEADLAAVNLARGLVDGEQIHVPEPGESPPVALGDSDGGELAADGASGGADSDGPIDLNTAGPRELEELSGVGPAIAQRIIDHREKNGPFRSVDDLLEVSGIGPATLEKIRDQITVSP